MTSPHLPATILKSSVNCSPMSQRKFGRYLLYFSILLLAACDPTSLNTPEQTNTIHTDNPADTEAVSPSPIVEPPSNIPEQEPTAASPYIGYTNFTPHGNRLVSGKGNFPAGQVVDIPLVGSPEWVLGAPFQNGIIWVVRLDSGVFEAFLEVDRTLMPWDFPQNNSTPGAPFTLIAGLETASDYIIPVEDLAPFAPPTLLQGSDLTAGISTTGELIIYDQIQETTTRLDLQLLPDARLLHDDQNRILVLSGSTDRYSHSVLGDSLEGGGISLIQAGSSPQVLSTIVLEEDVVEGLAPIWTDLDLDGDPEILVTLSNRVTGARLAVYREDGTLAASSAPIGTGFRWQHQIAAGPLGPDGEIEIVSVRTPHLGGVVEYHRISGDRLLLTASLPGYSSHVLGSRNLDLTTTNDFNGDGILELLIPNQNKTTLAAIQRHGNAAQVIWNLPIGGRMTTNLAIASDLTGRMSAAIGRSDNTLRIWLP